MSSTAAAAQAAAAPARRNCCTWPVAVIGLSCFVTALILAWQFAPTDDIVDGIIPDFEAPSDTPEPTPSPVTSPTESPYEFIQCPTAGDCCNGGDYCDLRVNEILWASGHNLMSTLEGDFTFGYNHLYSLESALDAGYRGLNLDVCSCGAELQFCHDVCNYGPRVPSEVFANIKKFLDDFPSEVIVITFQVNDGVSLDDLYSIMESVDGFVDMMYVHQNSADDWPLMGTLVNDNKRIVVFQYNGECPNNSCPDGIHSYFEHAAETEYNHGSKDDLLDTANSCKITRGDDSTKSFFTVNNFVTPPNRDVAEEINRQSFIEDRLAACGTMNGLQPNMVLVDFWSIGELPRTVQESNTILAEQRRTNARLRRGEGES